jgi:hypothetical protein
LAAPRPPPRQCFRSPRINSANARFGLWDAWQAVLSALTWPNVEMRFEFHAERPRFYQYPTYKGFNHRQGEKTEEEFFTRHAHPRRRLGRSAADVLNRAGDRPQARPKRVRVALELLQLGGRRRPTPHPLGNRRQYAVASSGLMRLPKRSSCVVTLRHKRLLELSKPIGSKVMLPRNATCLCRGLPWTRTLSTRTALRRAPVVALTLPRIERLRAIGLPANIHTL